MNAPGRDRFAKLTQAQLSCLRLVNQHKNSKEIAVLLGISHHTVNKHVESASRLLGTNSRRATALLLAEYEARPEYERFAYEPLAIVGTDQDMSPHPQSVIGEEQSGADGVLDDVSGNRLFLADHGIAFDHSAIADPSESPRAKFGPLFSPRKWGQPNALSITNRLIAAFAILSASIIITALLIAALEGLSRLLG